MELPNTVRNVNKSWGVSNSLVMSREDVYAVAGIRLVHWYNIYNVSGWWFSIISESVLLLVVTKNYRCIIGVC